LIGFDRLNSSQIVSTRLHSASLGFYRACDHTGNCNLVPQWCFMCRFCANLVPLRAACVPLPRLWPPQLLALLAPVLRCAATVPGYFFTSPRTPSCLVLSCLVSASLWRPSWHRCNSARWATEGLLLFAAALVKLAPGRSLSTDAVCPVPRREGMSSPPCMPCIPDLPCPRR